MTEESWTRILQRAGEGVRGDAPVRGPEALGMRSGQVARPAQRVTAEELESNLRNALLHAARNTPAQPVVPVHRPSAAAQRERPPVHMAPPPPAPRLPVPQPPLPQPPVASGTAPRRGGMRNVVVISVSIAVIGLATHGIRQQWNASRTGLEGARLASSQPLGSDRDTSAAAKDAGVVQTSFTFQPVDAGDAPVITTQQDGPADITDTKAARPDAALSEEIGNAERILKTGAASGAPAASAQEPKRTGMPEDEERALLERAIAHLHGGDIATARLFLEHLANRRSAAGAVLLAKTYDRRYLTSLGVRGLTPDTDQARKWYRKAADLGSPEAAGNLESLR